MKCSRRKGQGDPPALQARVVQGHRSKLPKHQSHRQTGAIERDHHHIRHRRYGGDRVQLGTIAETSYLTLVPKVFRALVTMAWALAFKVELVPFTTQDEPEKITTVTPLSTPPLV